MNAGQYDKIMFRIDQLEAATISVTAAESYFSTNYREYSLRVGDYLEIRYPAIAFITAQASENKANGSFTIGYAYEEIMHGSAFDEVAFVDYEPKTEKKQEVPYILTTEFFAIILIAVITTSILILIAMLCVYAVREY